MNRFAVGMAGLLVLAWAGAAGAGPDHEARPLRVEVDLVDGSRVVGVPAAAAVPLQMAYAKVEMSWKKILSLGIAEDHETVAVSLRNGDRLSGVLTSGPLSLATVFGDVSIGLAHIRGIRVVLSGGDLPEALKKGLVLRYSMDREEGAKITDLSGSAHDGRITGATFLPQGRVGGGYAFDGRKDVITVDSFATDSDDLTVAAWVRPASFDRDGACWNEIVDAWVGGGDTPFRLGLQNHRLPGTLTWSYESRDAVVSVQGGQLPVDVWTHVAGVRRKTGQGYRMALYCNGQAVATATSAVEPGKHASQEIAIGARTKNPGTDERFHGAIDEVLLFHRALSDEEVAQLYGIQP